MGGKIDEMRGAGFSDQEISDYATQKRQEMQGSGFAPNEIDGYFNGVTVPPDPPKPFLNRLVAGMASTYAVGSKAASAFSQSFSSDGQLGFSDQTEKQLRDIGIFRDSETGRAGPLRFMNEAVMKPTAAAVDALMRAPPALIAGAAAGAREVGRQEGQSEQQGASMERELNLFGNFALQAGGADVPPELSISKPTVDPLGHVTDTAIGGLPRSENFNNAVKALAGGSAPERAEQKLLTLYTDHGFHPAEVAHDAGSDVTVTQHMLSDGPDLPYGLDKLAQAKAPELDAALTQEGIDPRNLAGSARDKVLDILASDPEANPLDAYQRVIADMTRAEIEKRGIPNEPARPTQPALTPPADILRDLPSALTQGSIDAKRFSSAPTTEQLDAIIQRGQQHEDSEMDRLFGADSAEVKKLMRSNSERASDRLDELIHDKYGYASPQNDIVYGTNGAHIVNMESLRSLRDTISNVEFEVDAAAAGKESALDRELAWLAPKLPDISKPDSAHTEPERIAILGLARAFEDMTAKGLDPEPILKRAVDYTLQRTGGDADDASVLLEKIAPYVRRWTGEEAARAPEESLVGGAVGGPENTGGERPPEGGGPAGSSLLRSEQPGVPQPATGGAGGGGEVPANEHPVPSEGGGGGAAGGGGGSGSGGEPLGIEGPRKPLSDAQQKVLSRLSVGEEDPTRKMTFDRLYTHVIDQLFPISKATKEAEAERGSAIPTPDNPYQLARLISGVAGKAEHMLNHGMFDFESYENVGPSLKEILAPVKDDLEGFRAFATALRSGELEREGIKTGVDLDAAREVAMTGNAKYGSTLLKLVDYQNNLARYLKDSGVLSQGGYDAMTEKWAFYVPFNRVMGDGIGGGPKGAGASLQARNPVHAIEGSERIIVDPIENVVRNTYLFTSMAEKNAVGVKLIDMLLSMGDVSELKDITPQRVPLIETTRGKELTQFLEREGIQKPPIDLIDMIDSEGRGEQRGEITIFRDGKRETYMVDPDLARSFKGLDVPSVGLLEKLLSIPANLLRAGATLTPDFALRHMFRDYIYAAVTAKEGVFTPADSLRGFVGLITKDQDYQNWLKGGGANISMVSMDRRYLQHSLAELTGQTGLMTRAWNVIGNPEASAWAKAQAVAGVPVQAIDKFALSPLRMLTEFAEGASHLGAFKREIRAMEQEGGINKPEIQSAAWTSRDTAVDAARRGASMRAYNMITAFAQITLQDSDRIVRAIRDNPAKTLLSLALGISLPSALLWAHNHNDPRYQELPQWERDIFWIFLTDSWTDLGDSHGMPDRPTYDAGNGTSNRISGGRIQRNDGYIFRLPKPFGAGVVFGSGVERAMEAIFGQNANAFDHFINSIAATVVPQFFPTAAAPVIEQWANRSTFTNRTLIPDQMEKFLPEYQYTPYTSEAAKAIGRLVGAFPGIRAEGVDPSAWGGGVARAITSPILLENYLRGWTGTLGMYALSVSDYALRKSGVLPDPPLPASTLADIPVIRAFTVRYPTATAQSIQDFHDAYAINKSFYATWQNQMKEGDLSAARAIQAAGGLLMFARLDNIEKTLRIQNQAIRNIYKNPTQPPDEKRQQIDSIYYGMIQTAHIGMKTMEGISAAARANGTLH